MSNETEGQVFYQTFDKEKDESNTRIFIFAGINDGKNFYPNTDLLYNEDYIQKIKNSSINNVPVFTRENIETKEMIQKDIFKKAGILLKEDIYKFVESEIDGETVIYSVLLEKV